MEQMVAYFSQVLNKVQREGYRSVMAKEAPAAAFMRYVDDYFQRTVFTPTARAGIRMARRATLVSVHCGPAARHMHSRH